MIGVKASTRKINSEAVHAPVTFMTGLIRNLTEPTASD